MIKTITFGEGHLGSPEDAIIFRTEDRGDRMFIVVSFPFHEDMHNLMISVPDALSIRNTIDDLVAIKMLGEPEPYRTADELNETIRKIYLSRALLNLENEFALNTKFDQGARAIIDRLRHNFKINRGGH